MGTLTKYPEIDRRLVGRREFLGLGAGVALAAAFRAGAETGDAAAYLKPRRIAVACGLARPFSVLHISDTHLSLMSAKELENAERARLHRDRNGPMFPHGRGAKGLAAAVAYAASRRMPIVHTGDLIDFYGEANATAVRKFTAEGSVYAVAGNHEWAYFMYTRKEDVRRNRDLFIARLCDVYRNDLDVSARVIGGVNFVAFDDWDSNVTKRQSAFIDAELAKGLPTILLCHCPFYVPRLHAEGMERCKDRPHSDLVGLPLAEHERIRAVTPSEAWHRPTKTTLEFTKRLKAAGNLKAILCGHLHRFHEERFSPTAIQYVVGANSAGAAYEVSLS